MLDEQQVINIYKAKVEFHALEKKYTGKKEKMKAAMGLCAALALEYGVTPRAIRNILNRQAWPYATRHLWHLVPSLESHSVDKACSPEVLKFTAISVFGSLSFCF
jgi:hypothetical protein